MNHQQHIEQRGAKQETGDQPLTDHQRSAVLNAVKEGNGIAFDGLRITSGEEGYRVRAGEKKHVARTVSELKHLINRYADYVTNWFFWERTVESHGSAFRSYLRWLESAETDPVPVRYRNLSSGEVRRTWGELSITVQLTNNGNRIYNLMNQADRSKELSDLSIHVDPLDARELSKYNDEGDYRPLKGRPDLQTGWVFPGLRYEKLVRAVDFFYPASLENWHRARNETLDVTHYREAAERHTGMFNVLEKVDSDLLTSVVSDCCTDSNCLKRREWQESTEQEIDVPSGDGSIPCREPCAFFIDRARDQFCST